MDFNKFSEAGRNIKLTEEKKREIVNACRNCETDGDKPVSPNFKRTVAAICALIIVLTAGVILTKHIGNGRQIPVGETDTSTALAESTVSDTVPSEKSSETTKPEPSDIGCGDLLPRKYRNNYYSIPASFINIVGEKVYEEWEGIYYAENYADDTNVMVMLAYVKEFNISKEDFEKANLKYARFIDETYSHICLDPQDYADQEMQEIYNADIIYTFDNEIINEYYLGIDYPFLNEYQYEEAVANGMYQTRTTEFIYIEQMETEIIAKYGETEIVR